MLVSLLLCAAAIAAAIALLQRHGQSFGMPLAYLFALAMIHLPGGLVHWLRPGALPGTLQTAEGLSITALSMLAFVGGMAWWNWRTSQSLLSWDRRFLLGPVAPRFWRFCTTGGLIIGFVLAPLRVLPSAGALIQSAGLLWMAGVILAIRFHISPAGNRSALLSWLAVSLINPFISLFGGGFLGYGITALTQVYSFLLVRRQRLLRSLLVVVLAFYLGLGVAAGYMATRFEIRSAVWGGGSAVARLTTIRNTAEQIRLFDPQDPDQAFWLDRRFNQNFLVGAAALGIEGGYVQFQRGKTLVDAVLALIPRALWPGKPAVGGSGSLVTDVTGIQFIEGTSVGIGSVMEAYVNFGRVGCVVLFAALGAVLRWLDLRAYRAEARGDYRAYLTSLLPALALIQPGGSFAEVTSSVAAAWIAARLWFALWQKRQRPC